MLERFDKFLAERPPPLPVPAPLTPSPATRAIIPGAASTAQQPGHIPNVPPSSANDPPPTAPDPTTTCAGTCPPAASSFATDGSPATPVRLRPPQRVECRRGLSDPPSPGTPRRCATLCPVSAASPSARIEPVDTHSTPVRGPRPHAPASPGVVDTPPARDVSSGVAAPPHHQVRSAGDGSRRGACCVLGVAPIAASEAPSTAATPALVPSPSAAAAAAATRAAAVRAAAAPSTKLTASPPLPPTAPAGTATYTHDPEALSRAMDAAGSELIPGAALRKWQAAVGTVRMWVACLAGRQAGEAAPCELARCLRLDGRDDALAAMSACLVGCGRAAYEMSSHNRSAAGGQAQAARLPNFALLEGTLRLPAASLIKGLSELKLSTAALPVRLTLKELAAIRAPPTSINPYCLRAVRLLKGWSWGPPPYRDAGGVRATALHEWGSPHPPTGPASVPAQSHPRLVVGSWNMRATYSMHGTDAPGFVPNKLERLAGVAEAHGMALIALQECPGPATRAADSLPSLTARPHLPGGRSAAPASLFSAWEWCEAQTGEEGAGFLYDPTVLQLITAPVAFPNPTPRAEGGAGHAAFKRPPVLAVFKAAGRGLERADAAAGRLGLIVVCNVHLKSSEKQSPELPQADVRLLASKCVQDWIDDQLRTAAAAQPGTGSPKHCVLIIGDFNLAGASACHGDSCLHGVDFEDLPQHVRCTYPGSAWEGLEGCGYRLLLHGGHPTNFGPPVTKASCAYDNALVRFSDPEAGSMGVVRAGVCEVAGQEVIDMEVLRTLTAPNPKRTLEWEGTVAAVGKLMLSKARAALFTAWSDHKPIVVHL
ncbi:MAG: hypothetical protein WDW36_006537 [Sanguina aurantia]